MVRINKVITINDEDDLTMTAVKPIHPRDRLKQKLKLKRKRKNKKADVTAPKKSKSDSEVQIIGQTPLHPRERLRRAAHELPILEEIKHEAVEIKDDNTSTLWVVYLKL